MIKPFRDLWAWLAGGSGITFGHMTDHDVTFWLGMIVLLLTVIERGYEIFLKHKQAMRLSENGNSE